ncbi:MAG: AAA family ATPase [Ferruginibacter sp.]
MNKPFNYGKIAEFNYFTNRTKEVKWLEMQINAGINCILMSPRRWGKSSLVQHTANIIKKKYPKVVFCFLDLYNIRSEKEFLELFSTTIIKATSSSFDDAVRNVKAVFKQLIPSVAISADPNAEIELSFNWKELQKNITEVLNLPEKISLAKNMQVVVCIDEFQNISFMEDGIAFQKKLRAHWQKHQKANYILYGSRRHLMMDFFTKSSTPFYRFGEIMFLEKISETHWVDYISERFLATNKKISDVYAASIAVQMENHPYYVQQYAQAVWQQTNKVVNARDLTDAMEDLLDQYTILYQKEVDMLTNFQLNFLKALCNNETAFGSKRILEEYDLGTSANITRIKTALQNHEMIDLLGKTITFNDPLFTIWLKKRFFKR